MRNGERRSYRSSAEQVIGNIVPINAIVSFIDFLHVKLRPVVNKPFLVGTPAALQCFVQCVGQQSETYVYEGFLDFSKPHDRQGVVQHRSVSGAPRVLAGHLCEIQ